MSPARRVVSQTSCLQLTVGCQCICNSSVCVCVCVCVWFVCVCVCVVCVYVYVWCVCVCMCKLTSTTDCYGQSQHSYTCRGLFRIIRTSVLQDILQRVREGGKQVKDGGRRDKRTKFKEEENILRITDFGWFIQIIS